MAGLGTPRKMTLEEKAQIEQVAEGGIDENEKAEISALLKELDPAELDQFNATIRASLNSIIQELQESNEIQGPIEYSIDGLVEHVSEDEKAKAFLELYKSVIADDLSNIYGEKYDILTDGTKNTIQLVFWNIIQSKLGASGAVDIGKGMLGNLTEGFTGLLGKADEEATESVLTASLQSKEELIGKLAGGIPGVTDTLVKDISQVIDIVESLLGTQANNLNTLLEATQNHPKKDQILENPLIVESIMNTGKYSENSFNIDITTSPVTIQIGDSTDIENIQQAYLNEMKEDTANLGSRMDRMRNLKERADDFLGKIGIEGGLDGLFEALYKAPIIGVFFKMIFGDFFDKFDSIEGIEAVDRVLDSLGNIPAAISMKNLQDTFLPEFTKNYPNKASTALGKFLTSRTPAFTEDFYTSLSDNGNFFSKLSGATPEISMTSANFWDQVLMGQNIDTNTDSGKQINIIHSKLVSIGLLGNGDITQEQILTALNSITSEELTIIPATTPDANPAEMAVILDQITAIDSLPATLTMESGEEVEISIFDNINSSITINNVKYQISLTGNNPMIPVPIPLAIQSINISGGKGIIRYTHPTKGIQSQDIEASTIQQLIKNIVSNGEFSHSGLVDINNPDEGSFTFSLSK